jgi:hypothetical protein
MFLAVSGVLLALAIVSIRGQSAQAEFTSGVNEVKAKMDSVINQVVSGYSTNNTSTSASLSNYECILDASGSPQLRTGVNSVARGANPECIFLGKVLQVNDDANDPQNNTHIYIYNVLGRRSFVSGGASVNVTSMANAKPTAATSLTEDYQMPNGIRVLSATTGVAAQHNTLTGIYTNLAGGSSGSASDLIAVQYPYSGNFGINNASVLRCVTLLDSCDVASAPGPATDPWPLNTWNLCLVSGRGDNRGKLTISSSNGLGVTTKLQTGKGSAICS